MRRILTLLLLCTNLSLPAQTLQPEEFVFPIRNVAGLFSANFGEMRTDHFHSGIDIKTDGVEGKPVIAAADGYISRIAVTPGGYGRAVYIAHPNGTTSVYGHLSKFRDDIEEYVHAERYRTRQNSINLYPAADRFPLGRGEEFARSGNTGSSAGPHLHFEIRDTRTQRTLNTISSGVIRTRDNIPPRLVKLYYVETDTLRGVPVHSSPRPIELTETAPGSYAPVSGGPVPVGGNGYFLLETTDRKNDVQNTFGVWRVAEFVDGEPIFEFRIDGFAFDQTRYCNAVVFYPMQVGSRNEVIRLTRLDGCIDDFYPVLKNRGLVTPMENQRQQVRIVAEDDSGNRSTLEFQIVRQDPARDFRATDDPDAPVVDNRRTFARTDGELSVRIPAGSLYEPIFYRQSKRSSNTLKTNTVSILSPIYSILDERTPLHAAVTISIRAFVPQNLQPHTTLGIVRNDRVYYAGGKYKDGAATVPTRSPGDFCVVADTIPPKIEPRFNPSEPIRSRSITFRLSDNFSGIASYTATLDGEWILLERNPMQGTVTHTFDERRTPRGRSYRLTVTAADNCGNRTVYRTTICR